MHEEEEELLRCPYTLPSQHSQFLLFIKRTLIQTYCLSSAHCQSCYSRREGLFRTQNNSLSYKLCGFKSLIYHMLPVPPFCAIVPHL